METYQIEILEPGAKKLLDDMAEMDLIAVRPAEPKAAFKRVLEKLRSNDSDGPGLQEITGEVDAVRTDRYSRR